MSNKCHNTALKTRARTREILEGPAHGGPRTPVPPKGARCLPSRRAKRLSSSALWSPGEKRPEKAEAKTDQGSVAAAGGVKAVGVKEEEKKEEADRARFSVPLWCSSSPRWSRCPGASPSSGCLAYQTLWGPSGSRRRLTRSGGGGRTSREMVRDAGGRDALHGAEGEGCRPRARRPRSAARPGPRWGHRVRADEFEAGPPGGRRP